MGRARTTARRRVLGLRLCLWSGPVLCALFFVGMVVLAGIIPPTSPTGSSEEIAAFFRDDVDAIRFGLVLAIVAMSLIAPFGIAVAELLRDSERGTALLTNVQVASVAVGTSVAVVMCLIWATASFRPDELAPDTTRMLNDLAWFIYLFTWAPFSIWVAAVGLAILWDEREAPPFPRWAAYLSFWIVMLFQTALLMIFFKTGPFAYDGAITFYVPTATFFGWIMITAVLGLRALRQEARGPDPEPALARRGESMSPEIADGGRVPGAPATRMQARGV